MGSMPALRVFRHGPVKYRFTAGCQRSGGIGAHLSQCKRGPGPQARQSPASGAQPLDAGPRIRRTRTRSDHEQKVPTRRDCPASRPRQRQLPGAAGRHGRPVAIDGLVYRLGDRGRARAAQAPVAEARESAGEWETAARQRARRASVYADEVVHEHAWKSAGVAALVGCCWDAAWPRAAGAERSRRDVRRRAPAAESPGRGAGRDGRPPAGSGGRRLRLELAGQRGREVVRGLERVRLRHGPAGLEDLVAELAT